LCSGLETLSLFRSLEDCITITSGYDFRKGQAGPLLSEKSRAEDVPLAPGFAQQIGRAG
jgi:hypothetical protein